MRKNFLSKLPIIIAFFVPIIAIAVLAIAVYIPSSKIDPKYDFLYTTGTSYAVEARVVDEKLQIIDRTSEYEEYDYAYPREQLRYYIYDMSEETSKEISASEATELQFVGSIKSPDGYEVRSSDYGAYSLFGHYDEWQVIKGDFGRNINMNIDSSEDYSIEFIGWIQD